MLEKAKQQAQTGLAAAKEKAAQLEEQGRQAAVKLQQEAVQKAAQVSQQLLEQQEAAGNWSDHSGRPAGGSADFKRGSVSFRSEPIAGLTPSTKKWSSPLPR